MQHCACLTPRSQPQKHPVTPDGRYFVVSGRLWRMTDPAIDPARRDELVNQLMAARRAVGMAARKGDERAEAAARDAVDEAKRSLGERGLVWWDDAAPDLNRQMVRNTPYASWYAEL